MYDVIDFDYLIDDLQPMELLNVGLENGKCSILAAMVSVHEQSDGQ